MPSQRVTSNGDGLTDIVTANQLVMTFTVLLGGINGGFQREDYPAGTIADECRVIINNLRVINSIDYFNSPRLHITCAGDSDVSGPQTLLCQRSYRSIR